MKLSELGKNYKLLKRNSAMEKELLQALSYVRNNVILGRGKGISSEVLMEELADVTSILKPAFQDMGHFLHICDKEKAQNVLYGYFGTGFSKDLGRFLAEWEEIPSEELLGTIEIYMDSLREDNLEKKQRRDEVVSDLIYFPVVINAMLVLLDFVYVAFLIEQQNFFSQLF